MGTPTEIPTFFIFKPHVASITTAALHRVALAAAKKGQAHAQKVLAEILAGKRPGAYCARCGLEFEFINKIYKKKPLRLLCTECKLSVRSVEAQHGPLLPAIGGGSLQLS